MTITESTSKPTWDGGPGITIVTNSIINNDLQLPTTLSISNPEVSNYTLTTKKETMGSGELRYQPNFLYTSYFTNDLNYNHSKKTNSQLKQRKVRCLLIFDSFIV